MERTLSGPAETPLPGRLHPGTAVEIISERRARSNRNGGRDHPGTAGDFPRNQHSTAVVIGSSSVGYLAEGDGAFVRRRRTDAAASVFSLESHQVIVRAPLCISNPLSRLRKLMPITDCGSFSITAACTLSTASCSMRISRNTAMAA